MFAGIYDTYNVLDFNAIEYEMKVTNSKLIEMRSKEEGRVLFLFLLFLMDTK